MFHFLLFIAFVHFNDSFSTTVAYSLWSGQGHVWVIGMPDFVINILVV